MKISIITLFPNVFEPILGSSIIGRAQKNNLVAIEYIDLRKFGTGAHQVVDGRPYGGGVGMVLRVDILAKALNSINQNIKRSCTILMSAGGRQFKQKDAQKLAKLDHLIIVCGHYEGVDQRFIDKYVDSEYSIGDFVLTGGEIPAMALIDATVRLIPNVIKKPEAIAKESFSGSPLTLEHPHYTRPDEFEGLAVPEILLSGNHQQIENWRQEMSIEKTKKVRSDLLKKSI